MISEISSCFRSILARHIEFSTQQRLKVHTDIMDATLPTKNVTLPFRISICLCLYPQIYLTTKYYCAAYADGRHVQTHQRFHVGTSAFSLSRPRPAVNVTRVVTAAPGVGWIARHL